MGHAAQELLAVANADSHDLIRHSLSNLNDRVQILEGQAKDQGDKLRTIDRQYKLYQVTIKLLAVANADSHDLICHSLSNLNDRVQILEGQAKDQGDKLRTIDRQYKLYQVSQIPEPQNS